MSEQPHDDDNEFAARIRSELDAHVDALDAETLARLRSARRSAIADLEMRTQRRASWWVPVSVFATAGMAAVVFSLWGGRLVPVPAEDVAEIEMLAASDDLEMVEDLEFYEWLDATDATAG